MSEDKASEAAVLAVLDNLDDRSGFDVISEIRSEDEETWSDLVADTKAAILTALTAAGYVVVPREPTIAIIDAMRDKLRGPLPDYIATYRAMIAAREGGK